MTSQHGGRGCGERESLKHDACVQLTDASNRLALQLRGSPSNLYQHHQHAREQADRPKFAMQSGRRTTVRDSKSTDPAEARCSTNAHCTPHSIDDILQRRPRPLLCHPEHAARATSGHEAGERLEYGWSGDEVGTCRLSAGSRSAGDEREHQLTSTWTSIYDCWSQRHHQHHATDARTQARLTADNTTTRPGSTDTRHDVKYSDSNHCNTTTLN